MRNSEDRATLTPEIVRSLDAADGVVQEVEQVRKQRLASWDSATIHIERIADRIVGIAGKVIGVFALAMLVFDFGRSEPLISLLRDIAAGPSGVAVPVAGIAFLLGRAWIRSQTSDN